jgi:hypothetical protein
MIKGYIFPIFRRMAGDAILTQLTLVRIVFAMTGKAVARRIL